MSTSLHSYVLIVLSTFSQKQCLAQYKTIDQKIDSLIEQMTLPEKAGQMNQYSADFPTGPITSGGNIQDQIIKGKIGSFLNVSGASRTRSLQELAMKSRLKIPLLFGQDVLHGYRTVLPIPIAEACSWDMEAIEHSARIAAVEASATGLHWVFAPMVDIARDPRWGRVMEGAGEDPYLASLIAASRVRGFQGKGLGHTDAVMACVKHFAAYGAAMGGRDYNSVDMSKRQLFDIYLPPFRAAVDAGVASVMNAFNDLNGIPATASTFLQRDILKTAWDFEGIVLSDWGSIGEMVAHGYASDLKGAAAFAVNGGCDIDMESRAYIEHLPELVANGQVDVAFIDEAVRRILKKKFELGLFDNPYKYCSETREAEQWNNPEHKAHAREMAKKSIVLLKNQDRILPLHPGGKKIALIGPLVKSRTDHLGFWSYDWPDDSSRLVSLWDGVMSRVSDPSLILYAQGCGIRDTSTTGFEEAIAVAMKSDIVVINVGEERAMTGEARSRSQLDLPGVQNELIKVLAATGKPIVLIISAGRPLVFSDAATHASGIVYTWWLGMQAGHAIADVLFGEYNPSAKLPITFPRSAGQIPIYYNHLSTGRPPRDEQDVNYVSAYNDLPNSPAYPFGFGLSYTTYTYSEMNVDSTWLAATDTLHASIRITNTGDYGGEEIVQLYIRDVSASLVRPVKELKRFSKIYLEPGENKVVTFTLTADDLKFYTEEMEHIWEAGVIDIMIGPNARDLQTRSITWNK